MIFNSIANVFFNTLTYYSNPGTVSTHSSIGQQQPHILPVRPTFQCPFVICGKKILISTLSGRLLVSYGVMERK